MKEKEKTGLYGQDKNKTGLYGQDKNKTGLYTSKKTDKAYVNPHDINPGDTIVLKGKSYSLTRFISLGTGEANVYEIEDSEKHKFALKLYYEFNSEQEEPNEVALNRIQKLDDPDILKLIDFGVGPDKYKGRFCYEISELAPGGNILEVEDFKEKYTPQFIENQIIPQIYLAITKLHEYKVYHCDLKPSNILYKDIEQSDIILGDYGSAKAYDLESEKDLRKSSTVKGTEFYLPPEQARGIVSAKNDYYSFGMIILHLLYPEEITSGGNYREIDSDKFEQIVERQYGVKPIIDFNPKLKRLNCLIEGLTLINHLTRWGEDEVERWTKGESIEVAYRSGGVTDVEPLEIGRISIMNGADLVHYIETKSTWFQDLFEDQDVFKLMKKWLDTYIGIPDRKRFESLVNIYKLSGKKILQAAVTMFFLPHQALIIEKKSYDFNDPDKLAETVGEYIAHIDGLYRFATVENLCVWFFQLEYALKWLHYQYPDDQRILALLLKIYNPIKGHEKIPEDFDYKTILPALIHESKEGKSFTTMLSIFYAFNKERPYPDYEGNPIKSAEELALFYINNEGLYADKYHTYERNALLDKLQMDSLINADSQEFFSGIFADQAEMVINIDYISFEKVCNVNYSVKQVLDSWLKAKGINKTILLKEESASIYVAQNSKSTSKALKDFVAYVEKGHKGMSISAESVRQFEKEFVKKHRKHFLPNTIVTWVTIILIAVLIVIMLVKWFSKS